MYVTTVSHTVKIDPLSLSQLPHTIAPTIRHSLTHTLTLTSWLMLTLTLPPSLIHVHRHGPLGSNAHQDYRLPFSWGTPNTWGEIGCHRLYHCAKSCPVLCVLCQASLPARSHCNLVTVCSDLFSMKHLSIFVTNTSACFKVPEHVHESLHAPNDRLTKTRI